MPARAAAHVTVIGVRPPPNRPVRALSPEFQIAFNKVKGSVPARTDVDTSELDACGQKGAAELKAANDSGNLFGSMAHGYAAPAAVKNAIFDVVTAQLNGEYDSETAVTELVSAVEIAQ